MAITTLYHDLIIEYVQSLGRKAVVKISGIDYEYPILNTLREGNTVKHFVYLENETGTIEDVRLVDASNRNLQTRSISVEKGPDGLVVVFVITIKIEEAFG